MTQEESKHDKFIRLSTARSEKAVHHIGLLSNLSSANYEYSPEEAQAVVDTLLSAVGEVADALGAQMPTGGAQALSEPQQAQAPLEEAEDAAEPVAEAPKASQKPEGPVSLATLEPVKLSREDDLHLMTVGGEIDAAIAELSNDALQGFVEVSNAKARLLNLLRS